MKEKLPGNLNTDEGWAQLIRWLQERKLAVVLRANGDVLFECKPCRHLMHTINCPKGPH